MAVASPRTARARGVRWLPAPVVAAAFVAGVWLAGGVIPRSFRPALRVRGAPWGAPGGAVEGVAALGARKGIRGDEQYQLRVSLEVRGAPVLIGCRAFGPFLGAPPLRPRGDAPAAAPAALREVD